MMVQSNISNFILIKKKKYITKKIFFRKLSYAINRFMRNKEIDAQFNRKIN